MDASEYTSGTLEVDSDLTMIDCHEKSEHVYSITFQPTRAGQQDIILTINNIRKLALCGDGSKSSRTMSLVVVVVVVVVVVMVGFKLWCSSFIAVHIVCLYSLDQTAQPLQARPYN